MHGGHHVGDVSATSELFGAKNFDVNHNMLVSNIPVGSLCFGYFSAFLYQREAGARGAATCSGASCYQATFAIWGATCVVLYVRSRSFAGRLPVRLQWLSRLANLVGAGRKA